MQPLDYHIPSLRERLDLEERARQMRADAIRASLSGLARAVAALPRRLADSVRTVSHG